MGSQTLFGVIRLCFFLQLLFFGEVRPYRDIGKINSVLGVVANK